jgi:hypothetical protein
MGSYIVEKIDDLLNVQHAAYRLFIKLQKDQFMQQKLRFEHKKVTSEVRVTLNRRRNVAALEIVVFLVYAKDGKNDKTLFAKQTH